MQGGRIGVSSGAGRVLADVQVLRPTVFSAPPTFWNGLFNDFENDLRATNDSRTQKVLDTWRDRKVLGNRVAALISTGATLRHPVQRWLVRVFGKLVIDSYGCTETGGLCSNGSLALSAEIRLRDLPDMGYLTSDQPFPRGEILAKTYNCTSVA
eukprot:Skav221436  [mRNA]  locus=scaffold140:49097:50167:+ [translate_table: standard]